MTCPVCESAAHEGFSGVCPVQQAGFRQIAGPVLQPTGSQSTAVQGGHGNVPPARPMIAAMPQQHSGPARFSSHAQVQSPYRWVEEPPGYEDGAVHPGHETAAYQAAYRAGYEEGAYQAGYEAGASLRAGSVALARQETQHSTQKPEEWNAREVRWVQSLLRANKGRTRETLNWLGLSALQIGLEVDVHDYVKMDLTRILEGQEELGNFKSTVRSRELKIVTKVFQRKVEENRFTANLSQLPTPPASVIFPTEH